MRKRSVNDDPSPADASNEAYIQSSLYRIIAMLEEEFHASYTTMEANDNFYITQAVDYIKKSVSGYHSDRCRRLPPHQPQPPLRTFQKTSGYYSSAFLTSAKIINARELLTITDIPIANIATSCGYQNPFAFSRAFKKETGMTPREYREKYHHAEDLLDC